MVSFNELADWIKTHRLILILLLIILTGGFLRIFDLGAESIWLDEAYSIRAAEQSLSSVIGGAIDTENNPPLYFIILHLWMLLFGSSEIAIRFPSAIFGIISIFLIYKIGCHLFNQKIGIISGFLLSISTFHIMYSQDARPYSLFMFLTLLSFYFFIQVLKANKGWYFLGYLLANILLCYTQLFGFFVILSQIVYFSMFWKKYKQKIFKFAGIQVASLLAFIPLIVLAIPRISHIAGGGGSSISWIPEPSFLSIGTTFYLYAGGIALFVPLLVLFFIGLLPIRYRRIKGRLTFHFESVGDILLLLMWLAFPIFLPFILSMIIAPLYVPRYTISALPACYLLAARGIGYFKDMKVTYILVIGITLLSLIGLQLYYSQPVKEQWREAVHFIEFRAQPDDAIVICADYTQEPFDYYYEGDLERFGIGRDVTDTQKIDAVVDNATAGKERLWLVLSNQGVAITEEHLLNRFGSESVIAENELHEVKVYLFDLHVEPP